MSLSSPFANFYDDVFVSSTANQQETFLRQLFTLDGSLCASFWAYINPPLQAVEVEQKNIDTEVRQMQERIKRYPWDVLFDIDPTADEYITELTDLIDKDIIGTYQRKMEASCSTGDLLSALHCLRIIEQGTNLNWEEVEEPGSHHVEEVKEHIGYQFSLFTGHFLDHIFSVALIDQAITQVNSFQTQPEAFFDYAEYWEDVLEVFKDRLLGNI